MGLMSAGRFFQILTLVFVADIAPAVSPLPGVTTNGLSLNYNVAEGKAGLKTTEGKQLIKDFSGAIELSSATISFTDPRFKRATENPKPGDALLAGPAMRIEGIDTMAEVDWSLDMRLLESHKALVVSASVTNSGTADIELKRIDPFVVSSKDNGGISYGLGTTTDCMKMLTHGRMYYDPGKLLDFCSGAKAIDSFSNAAIHNQASGETLVAGFLDCDKADGHINARRTGDKSSAYDLSAQAYMHSRVLLKPGESAESGRVLLLFTDDGFHGLETYADLLGKLHKVKLNPIINGWSTWFVYYGAVTQAEVLKNAEFIARELKPYGMEWVQIDDGFQRSFGDWEGQPEKFPDGMKGVAEKIRAVGLRPGLWVAPFAVSAHSPLAKEHPEWLAHRANGEIQPIVPAHQPQAQYILDTTHPGAKQWLGNLFRTFTGDWGYHFIKTDFMEWTLLSAERFHVPSISTAAAYRAAVETQREAMGPNRHLLDCGPGPTVAGLIDSMRIGLDRPVPENPLWDQYAGFYNSTGAAVAKRYYFHNRTWINDPDHLRLGGLTIPQGRAAATIVALSGGTMISGDKLYELDGEKVEILKKALPSYGKSARPLDLFERDQPELFALDVERPFGKWKVLGCFNWGKDEHRRQLDLKALGISSSATPLVYEFWTKKLLPVTDAKLQIRHEPSSVQLLAIHEKADHPQVLGTDRHITMGGVELEDVKWQSDSMTLAGTARGAPGMKWSLAVHVPQGYVVKSCDGGTCGDPGNGTIPVSLTFTSELASWKIQFSR